VPAVGEEDEVIVLPCCCERVQQPRGVTKMHIFVHLRREGRREGRRVSEAKKRGKEEE